MSENRVVDSVYIAALERASVDRLAYLDEVCRDKPDLRKEVERLLAASERMDDFLEPVPLSGGSVFVGSADDETGKYVSREESIGAILAGKYKLFEEIGAGGMGRVYMAQQMRPVKRVVAVKVIKAGMDTKGVLARFEAERQALAMMNHPNIAHVLDAGTTELGRPFFVMELVKGMPITQYCDERKLTPRQRLELFIPVCHAIQHAHLKGVIHRDIKPSNVLVALYDDLPVPKVIDFGVAKATGQSLTDKTLMTGFGTIVGTPEYMSPEQANLNNLDVDTRSDVYSLGVLLYELLTGGTPVDRKSVGKAALLEILRIVREVEAPKPSVKLSTCDTLPSIAAARGTDPVKLSKLMKGELDWVLLKALDKDRARRYETANGFATDIQRYLDNDPVIARPPSTVYRLQKTWQRHKFVIGAGSAIALSLIIGLATSIWQASRAVAALNELRASAPAFAEQARVLAAKDLFDEALEKIVYASKLRPDVPEYLIAKGDLLQSQLRIAEAASAYRAALSLRPGEPRASASAQLCDELLAAPAASQGSLTRESLSQLHRAMQLQERPAAEILPVARLLGKEKDLVLTYWLERLKDLAVSADKPISRRLTMREDGLLALDLSWTKVANLAPLAGAPLAVLNLANAYELTSIEPLRGMNLIELNLGGTHVADLSPLHEMRSLERLRVDYSSVSDLTPLNGLKLRTLNITACSIRDISSLRSAALEEFSLADTRVTDLSPLAGMPLRYLDMGAVPVIDFSPLIGLPLEFGSFGGCQLTDLSVLRRSPIRELLLWNCNSARNFAVLNEIKTLELLTLPNTYELLPDEELDAIAALRSHPNLRQLGVENMQGLDHTTTRSKEVFWEDWDRAQSHFSALRKSGIRYSCSKRAGGTFCLILENQPLSDLSIFKGVPISELWLNKCRVNDLSPIQDLPIRVLGLHGSPISDLTSLARMPLEELSLDYTNVSDISPLTGLRLTRLYLHNCEQLDDVGPLAQIPTLEKLTIPIQARNIEKLRELPNLKLLSFRMANTSPYLPASTTAEFWGELDQTRWVRALRESNVKPNSQKRLIDGTWEVDLSNSEIVDLSPLRGARISQLWLYETNVSDLSPLRGMPLRRLHLYKSKVIDLSPLGGMRLEWLNLVSTGVSDLSGLRGMPLTTLTMTACTELTDLSPLADIKTLKALTLPPNAKDFTFLRDLPNLERISYSEDPNNQYRPDKTAAEFWMDYEMNPK